jgi:hypothetical protein
MLVVLAAGFPRIHLLSGILNCDAVALLDQAFQLLRVAFDPKEVIIGQFGPLGFGGANKLVELALECVFVHCRHLFAGLNNQTHAWPTGSKAREKVSNMRVFGGRAWS